MKLDEWVVAPARERFGISVEAGAVAALSIYVEELLRWNARINLTAITEPRAVAEKHLLDSLSIVPHVPEGATVLDAGTGAGLPGLVLAVVRPDVRVWPVDRTEKKVVFLKAVAARLGLRNVEPRHLRLEGDPEREGLAPMDVAVSRAFAAVESWAPLARAYVRPGGRILAMLGAERPTAEALGQAVAPDRVLGVHTLELPGGEARAIVALERAG